MVPIQEIHVPNYQVKPFKKLSGKTHFTEYGTPVPIEYWENQPDFELISKPIIKYLRRHFMNQRIGLRMLGSLEHADKTIDELLDIIREIGHDRYDISWKENKYRNIDLKEIELFMLELEIGQELGVDGEEQVKHALTSFYLYPKVPIRVDIGIVYDLSSVRHKKLLYRGEAEIGHEFIDIEQAPESILALFKIV